MTYAGFWRRFGAMLVDSVIYSVLLALLLGPHYLDSKVFSFEGMVSNGVALVLTILLWIRYLGTPGKLLLGCQVVDADSGEPMTQHNPGAALSRREIGRQEKIPNHP